MRAGDLGRLARLAAAVALTAAACGTEAPGPGAGSTAADPPPLPQALAAARQMLVVTTADWNAVAGELRRYERAQPGEAWRAVGDPVTIVVGRSGMAWDPRLPPAIPGPTKQEGDGRSPAGAFQLGALFGMAPHEEAAWWKGAYVHETPTLECVDDPSSRYYNQLVDRAVIEAPDWSSSEKMRAVGEAYRWGMVIEYNTGDIQRGQGSCVFLHIGGDGGRGTAGCTAMAAPSLDMVMRWLDPTARGVLVQMPEGALERVRAAWKLPA